MEPMYIYKAIVEKVIDGDTIKVTIDYGLRLTQEGVSLRVVGPDGGWFDAYEVNRGTEEQKEKGQYARDLLKTLLKPGDEVVLRTFKPVARDNFARWLASVWMPDHQTDIATLLVEKGLGYFDRKATQ